MMNAFARGLIALLGTTIATSAFGKVDFASQVLPILKSHCYDCHSAKKSESGFRLDVRAIAFKGGDLGEKAIEPGAAEKARCFAT